MVYRRVEKDRLLPKGTLDVRNESHWETCRNSRSLPEGTLYDIRDSAHSSFHKRVAMIYLGTPTNQKIQYMQMGYL